MKLRKVMKRIIALGTGATMMGATILGAMAAADLANYPAPFVKDGKFSGVLVVGDSAAAQDVIGVTDIATSLQYASTKKVSTSTTADVSVEGDAWQVGSASKKLIVTENNVNSSIVNKKEIRNISTYIDANDLQALEGGSIVNEKGTATYKQYIYWDQSGTSRDVRFMQNTNTDETADFFYISNADPLYRYELEFTTSFDTDVEDSAGSASTSGLYLGDYEDKKITIIGKEYDIVKARRTTVNGNSVDLTLMSGAVKDTLSEGESKTYTINGKEYALTVNVIDDTNKRVQFTVNGETTTALSDGSTHRFSDGTEIGVSEIIPNEAGDVTADMTTFYLGATKVRLKDTSVSVAGTGESSLEIGSKKISDAQVYIEGSDDNSTFKINRIRVNTTSDDDYYVGVGQKLSELMEKPEGLMGLDFEYQGFKAVDTEKIQIVSSGNSRYELKFNDASGNEARLPIAYTSGGTVLKLGDTNYNTILHENTSFPISRNDYFIITDSNKKRGERPTYALQYKGADKSSADSPVIKFKDLGSGDSIEISESISGAYAQGYIRLGGANYLVRNISDSTGTNYKIEVDMDADATVGGKANEAPHNITTKYGAEISIMNGSVTGDTNVLRVAINTIDSDDYTQVPQKPVELLFNITASSGEVRLSELGDISLLSPEDEQYTSYGYTGQGAFIKFDAPTNNPQTLEITYPKSTREPLVYVTAGTTKVTVGTGETVESVTVTKIEIGATKLASEVADATAQNVIAVGGPCANAVASKLKGSPADCAEGYAAGKGLIELFEATNGNVGLVVAGYAAADTRATAQVLANYGDYAADLTGTAVEVTTATKAVGPVASE